MSGTTTWIGNSPLVARKHYLQVTDEHFEKALRNPVQQAAVLDRSEPQTVPRNKKPLSGRGCERLARSHETLDGSGWESNPPNALCRRFAGFEDRGGHQIRVHSQDENGDRIVTGLVTRVNRVAFGDWSASWG